MMSKQILTVLLFLISLTMLTSCAKEETLKPDEEAGASQTTIYDGSGIGTGGAGGNGGSGGGNNGGGNLPSEYFFVDVDSVTKTYTSPFYQEALGIRQIVNDFTVLEGQIQISLVNEPQDSTYNNPLIGYFKSVTESYQSLNGYITFDSVSSSLLQGRFAAEVWNSNTDDTISLTNGRFLVHR